MIVVYCLIALLFWLVLHACLRHMLGWIDHVAVRDGYHRRLHIGLQVGTTTGTLFVGGLLQVAMNIVFAMHMVF